MTMHIVCKLQEKPEAILDTNIEVPGRVWNGIRPGWDDVDEYDACWNMLCDKVQAYIPEDYFWSDWYIDTWELA